GGAGAVSSFAPRDAAEFIWQYLLGGQDALLSENRHPWIVAVSLRVLDFQASRCSEREQALQWWGGAAGPAGASGAVGALGLLRSLERLLAAARLEAEPSLAPLGVRAVCNLAKLLLRYPELMPSVIAEDGEEVAQEADPEEVPGDTDAIEREHGDSDKANEDDARKTQTADSAGTAIPETLAEGGEDAERDVAKAELRQEEDDRASEKDDGLNNEESSDKEDQHEDEAGGIELEDGRQAGPSLFETVHLVDRGGDLVSEGIGQAGNSSLPAEQGSVQQVEPAVGIAFTHEMLRRSRVHWLLVRLSHEARLFLSQPSQHFVRLVCVFRIFSHMISWLPEHLLVLLLDPLLNPTYRCSSAFASGAVSSLPDIQSLEQALSLSTEQRLEFLAQLAQGCVDGLAKKLQGAGLGAEYSQAILKVRKAVERKRSDRVQKRKLLPVTDPEAAAKMKKAKLQRKQATKKRKLEETIISKRGGLGKTLIKQSRSLV
ncbi:unnamed protein product, partial [Prorocentrum cordatum]